MAIRHYGNEHPRKNNKNKQIWVFIAIMEHHFCRFRGTFLRTLFFEERSWAEGQNITLLWQWTSMFIAIMTIIHLAYLSLHVNPSHCLLKLKINYRNWTSIARLTFLDGLLVLPAFNIIFLRISVNAF